ncbi:MAG: thioredoxin domain-containing protein [Candidatus Omnitrophota bacterium]
MKYYRQNLLFSVSIVAASAILGASLIFAAKIVAYSINGKNAGASTDKMLEELVKTINEQNTDRPRPAKRNAEHPGSKIIDGVTAGSNPIKGKVNAPVLMVEFSDFQCPYSQDFYRQTFPLIEAEYIATGKVKFAYRDFPLDFHASAKSAAIAARCAGRQGKYWQMFDKLILSNSLDEAGLKKCAKEAGLNLNAYENLRNKAEIGREVEKDIKDAERFGVQGTPAFFINGRFVSGARPFIEFKKIIDEELAKSGQGK